MSATKRERWTEAEVLALPTGEHDYFDRKSGLLLGNQSFRFELAKALSAFANSGGGHLLIGVRDDGTFDGVDALQGRTTTREWFEQIIPNLLVYPLEDFRVHEVEPDANSAIPNDKVVIVIDVGDSILAPHQIDALPRTYFYRAGGHSLPAPHFYLETIRNRLTAPILVPELIRVETTLQGRNVNTQLNLDLLLTFRVTNIGRVAAYKWALAIDQLSGEAPNRLQDYKLSNATSNIRIDTTILPGLAMEEQLKLTVVLRPHIWPQDLRGEFDTLLGPDLRVTYRAVSETSRGESVETRIPDVMDRDHIFSRMMAGC